MPVFSFVHIPVTPVELLNNDDSCARAQVANNGISNLNKEDSKSITWKAESHKLVNNRYSALTEIDTEAI